MKKQWTKDQKDYLIKNYCKLPIEKIAKHLNRTIGAVQKHATENLKLKSDFFWTKEQDEILISNFANNRNNLDKILNKSWKSIWSHAQKLKLKANVKGSSNLQCKGYGDITGLAFREFKHSAKNRGRKIPFLVKIEYLDFIYKQQDKKCNLSREEINFIATPGHPRGNASLDRIYSDNAYEINNVQFVHMDVNFLKQRLTNDELIKWCDVITSFNQKKREFNLNPASSTIIIKRKGRFAGFGNISKTYWSSIRNRAEKCDLNFEIDLEYIWDLFIKQNGYCAFSGVEIKFWSSSLKNKKNEQTASLDRINPKLGYVIDNVRWVHKQLNVGKMQLSDERFFEVCEKISNRQKTKHLLLAA